VFSTWLYTGTGAAQTITNGIDLAGKGGLVWIKCRNAANNPGLYDTARGVRNVLRTIDTGGQITSSVGADFTAFNSNGFSVSATTEVTDVNISGSTLASWTFREAPRFFDIVTYTGNGASDRSIAHNLSVAPGMIVVKKTNAAGTNWIVYHRSLALNGGFPNYLILNTTAIADGGSAAFWASVPTSTTFSVGSNTTTNENGATYVAYLWAHDTASDGVIQCGTYTGNGSVSGPTVTLGWEPQWVMVKRASGGVSSWQIIDNMRGMPVGSADATLQPNLADAESSVEYLSPTATGFQLTSTNAVVNGSGSTYVYMAIRRGPMKTPTLGTSVFSPNTSSGGSTTEITTGFPSDLAIYNLLGGVGANSPFVDRLRGLAVNSSSTSQTLTSSSTAVESGANVGYEFWNTGFKIGSYFAGNSNVFYSFRRAPNFFDEVCYTGTGAARTLNHNLGVVPELTIIKGRSDAFWWVVDFDFTGVDFKEMYLQRTDASTTLTYANYIATGATMSAAPTSSTITLGNAGTPNNSGSTYVMYLFASCPGVSKVGSYTGTGALQTINCAFTTGARFVLIKRKDAVGDWYVWDSARGISSGNDPYLLLNSGAAQVTGTNYVDTTATGFQVTAAAPAGINAAGGTYIFLAIA
jgi:hypothetical protein